VVKLLVGLLKGAVIGGAVGYGAFQLAEATGFGNAWLTYGLIGALVGLFVGKPLWRLLMDKNSTNWIAVLKGLFGFGVGCGLYALIGKVWNPTFQIAGYPAQWAPFVGGLIGAIYGGFVELDDSIGDDAAAAREAKKQLPSSGPTPTKKKS
jgi:hypothetical protein